MVSNPIADMFRKEKFYGRPFPFVHLKSKVHHSDLCNSDIIRRDYQQITRSILSHRTFQSKFTLWKYPLYFIHTNDDTSEYYYGTDPLYIMDLPRFQNEIGMDEIRVNLFGNS